ERWMNEQVGWRAFVNQLKKEAPRYAQLFPELPRLLHDTLKRRAAPHEARALAALIQEQRRTNRLLQALLYGAIGFTLGLVAAHFLLRFALA
ncbi:MAG TPA: ubiquinone biosynthesis regulatory protein kinase UbiB, partial [Roseateles sp.]|nr:ubiquinone biosynthesis regulatory protein kinase UbiB [Roseateles sp.]